MLQAGNLCTSLLNLREIEIGYNDCWHIGCLDDHQSPGIDDHGAAKTLLVWWMGSNMCRSNDVAEIFDGPRPQQDFPVIPTGMKRECGRYHQDFRTSQYQRT